MNEKVILISIVSYREIELENTVKEFYYKAKFRDRLRFSIVSQSDEHPDLGFIPQSQMKYLKLNDRDTYGISWARAIAPTMFADYDFFFQTDGHMLVDQDWDSDFVKTYYQAKEKFGDKIVLSAMPARYYFKNNERVKDLTIPHRYQDISGKKPREWGEIKAASEPFKQIYFAQGALMFAERELIDHVPPDADIHYFAEELNYSVRCFINGYKVIYFDRPIIYHLYADDRKKAGVFRNPWSDEHNRLNILDNTDRSEEFFAGKLTGRFGATKEQLQEFCRVTGLVLPNL